MGGLICDDREKKLLSVMRRRRRRRRGLDSHVGVGGGGEPVSRQPDHV